MFSTIKRGSSADATRRKQPICTERKKRAEKRGRNKLPVHGHESWSLFWRCFRNYF
ncbi:cation-transporting P-type ATPase [Massiliimalia massiliensis]|uniref:cation-transporting P-type ATPase n=1 Tax=Massiliimalia massiliensis TaxID=1852384 RepID=UPI0009846E21|nr:hypothetical protein [Massiliimalia sp.]